MSGLFVLLHPFDGTEYGQEYLNLQKHHLVLELSREGDWASCLELKNHHTGWVPADYLKRLDKIPWHLTFALDGSSLMIQLVLPKCFYRVDGRPVVKACHLGFPPPMKFDSMEAAPQYKFRRIHMSLSSSSSEWNSCELAAFITRFITRFPSVDGTPIAFLSETVHGRLWFTSKEPIVTAKYDLKRDQEIQNGQAYLDAGPMMDGILLILGHLGLVLKENNWPRLEMNEFHKLHVSCDKEA